MPALKWSPENNAKLLQILVAIHVGTPEYKKIAAVFGPDVKDRAIQYRMGQLRQEGIALGFGPGTPGKTTAKVASVMPKTLNRATATATAKKSNVGVRKRGVIPSDEESVADTGNDSEQEATPPDTDENEPTTPIKRQKTIGGRITKARVSPRKALKKNYKKIEDPFADLNATDGDGEKVFGTDKSESEDSQDSDAEFGKGQERIMVKTEEIQVAI